MNNIKPTAESARRRILQTGLCIMAAWSLPGAAWAEEAVDNTITVTLLGTGSPSPNPDRFSSATLVQAGGLNMLFDDWAASAPPLSPIFTRTIPSACPICG